MNTQSPGLGHNEAPDYAQQTTERLASDYAEVVKNLGNLLEEARAQPSIIEDDQQALNCGAVIKRFKDLDNRLENVRNVEGEPFLRSKNAVDAFFFALRDKIGRRNKNDRKATAGAVDILQARINDHQDRKIAAERARLAAEQAERERVAREAARKAAEEARVAEEARQAALRARKPETQQAKGAAADAQEGTSTRARIEAEQAEQAAEEARLASLAKPSDIARVRGSDAAGAGVTLTVAQEPYAEVVDSTKLGMAALWPFFTEAEKEKALRAWARTTGHRVQMDGAKIGFRNKGVTR